ncbi:signal peptide peptidase SppA [Reichenbachiella agariperforans]|uniref:signal peptide peptidase SppA n=1 Tax=Reichenbachiella agariperforans TaxID=156994 RepID=UPI001C0A51A2|nr:signal peptide peptidase SppA [Reichenbachiella agariperforans]MBU2913416.1 signal peptide peptidase SppA [Reichenbachiella agariperforans]
MTFLKSVFSTLVGLLIFSFVIGFFFFVTIAGLIAISSDEAPEITPNSVLTVNLSGFIHERVAEDPFKDLFPESADNKLALLETIETIARAKTDDNIKGIYLRHGGISGGYSALHEIRAALEDFKSSGKFIYSYAEYMPEANYYVASVADEIYLNPAGGMEFNGLSANVSFFKGLLDKLDIEAQIFRVGTYKSAVEPFFRKDLSEANREQMTSFINDIYDNYLLNVSETRGIALDKLRGISDQMLAREPEDALKLGLITAVDYENGIKDKIREALGLEKDEDIQSINLQAYAKSNSPTYSSNKVAVIVAEGEIVSGKGDTETVGSDKFVKAIRDARKSDRVKAVVIRINSPGGSALASDVMWNEIMLTKAVKPVIASMSTVAASGGYYMAMPCDTIVAQPMTITGSIGIFGMIPNMGGFLENKLGITNDGVSTGEFSNLYRVSSALNEGEKAIIQNMVESGYESFTSKAAQGRNMSIEDLKAVASGRVWTGAQAKENGLVDVLGSYNDAVELAANAANLDGDYMISYYPALKTKWEELLGSMANEAEARIMKNKYGTMAEYVEKVKELESYKGIQARMPFEIEIK